MSDVDWVKARNECSLSKVFEMLKLQVEQDVSTHTTLRPMTEAQFSFVAANGRSFAVVRVRLAMRDVVSFVLVDNYIEVRDTNHEALFQATITLSNKGECRLNIAGEELELWQVRKMALESLLFNIP